MSKEQSSLRINIKFEGSVFKKLKKVMDYYGIQTGKDFIRFIVAKEYREIFETGDRIDDELFNEKMKEVDGLIEKRIAKLKKELRDSDS